MKICKRCQVSKDISEFGKNNRTKDKLAPNCRPCDSERVKEWKKANPESYQSYLQRRRVQRHHITLDQLNSMYEDHNKSCWLCKTPSSLEKLKIDHDHRCCPGLHSCGSCVRGLLCSGCNVLAGMFESRGVSAKVLEEYTRP